MCRSKRAMCLLWKCINYGTHHYTDGDCENGYKDEGGCDMFPIGLDVKKWLLSESGELNNDK